MEEDEATDRMAALEPEEAEGGEREEEPPAPGGAARVPVDKEVSYF